MTKALLVIAVATVLIGLIAAVWLLNRGDSALASGGSGNPPTILGIDVFPNGNGSITAGGPAQ